MKKILFFLSIFIFQVTLAQDEDAITLKDLKNQISNLRYTFDGIEKKLDDILWYDKVGDVAFIDKVIITGPPKPDRVEKNKTRQGYGNPLAFNSYVFIPRDIDPNKKYPLLLFPHGGVHSDFNTFYSHIIRELMAQQYIVVAPEYRGSTGYGSGFYKAIDYGGLEVEDVFAARNYTVENYDIVDSRKVGILGWSHGGLISLMNVFDHPESYQVAYAGVPVSDLIARMGYKSDNYRDLYSAEFHIGKTAEENVEEYKKRSPAWQAHKLKTPLLVHTNTNDDDVNVLEVEHLIKSLKAEGKKFEYEVYDKVPGGHTFDRIDTKEAQKIRLKVYDFLGGYLNPPRKLTSIKALRNAAYRY